MSDEEEYSDYITYNISDYHITPDVLDWSIGLDKKYTYDDIKQTAKDLFTLITPMRSQHDKIMAKINVTPHIMNKFEEINKNIDAALEDYIADVNVNEFINTNQQMGQTLLHSLHEEVQRYKTKINNIHKAWYNDWKDYGLIEDFQPKLRGYMTMDKSAGAKIKTNVKNIFKKILNDVPGDVNNNPLKYWLTTKALNNLSNLKSIRGDIDNAAYNANIFTVDTIQTKFKDFMLEIPKIKNKSISDAYYKLEEIMNYVENFGEIYPEINYSKNLTFFDRLDKMKIYDGYDIDKRLIILLLTEVYEEFRKKVNVMTDFVDFLKAGNNPYFHNFDEVAQCLFEIYFIRKSSDVNKRAFDIRNLAKLYEQYKINPKMKFQLNIQDSVTIVKMFKALGSAIGSGLSHAIPSTIKYIWNN